MFKRVYVEITNVCNLSCVFCPGTERAKRFLSPAEFRLMAESSGATPATSIST